MNAQPKPHNGDEHDKRLNGPQTVQGRLREWARSRHLPSLNVWPPESAIYSVLHSPGRSTNGKSDGGLGSFCDRDSGALRAVMRARETGEAVKALPLLLRQAIEAVYVVELRERPRTARAAADKAGIPTMTLYDRLTKAERIIARHICLDRPYPYTIASNVTV